jgi:peptide chain release factor subunit 1
MGLPPAHGLLLTTQPSLPSGDQSARNPIPSQSVGLLEKKLHIKGLTYFSSKEQSMHEVEELNRLAQWDTRPQPTLSLYLSLDQPREARLQALGQMVKSKEQQMKGNGALKAWEALAADLEEATRYLEELPMGPDRGLALFSCRGQGLFEAHTLPLTVPNLLEVGPSPYIRPLAALAGDHRRSLTVVLDQRRARFFESFLGRATELEDMELVSETTSPERDGDQGRAGDKRLSRRADEARFRHAKEINTALMEHFRKSDCSWLLLGGPKPAVEGLIPELHTYLGQRLAGTFACEVGTPLSQVSQAIADTLGDSRRQRQEQLLANLADNLGPNGKAATGLNQVLASLHEGRVHTLFVRRGFTSPGGSCPSCGRLRHVDGKCPLCNTDMTPVSDVVNLALAQALESGAILEQIDGDSALDDLGHIAALLRYA